MNQMNRDESRPWGTMLGLLASCLATLSGIVAGIDPDVILRRALQAGLAVAAIWTIGRLVFLTVLEATSKR